MKNPPQYAIINDVDRPYERLVVQLKDDGKYYYMHPDLKDHGSMSPRDTTTNLTDFGIDIIEKGNKVKFIKTLSSIARYSDGRTRNWQGESVAKSH